MAEKSTLSIRNWEGWWYLDIFIMNTIINEKNLGNNFLPRSWSIGHIRVVNGTSQPKDVHLSSQWISFLPWHHSLQGNVRPRESEKLAGTIFQIPNQQTYHSFPDTTVHQIKKGNIHPRESERPARAILLILNQLGPLPEVSLWSDLGLIDTD